VVLTDWCYEYGQRKEYDNQISACTDAIKSGRAKPHIAYNNRGNAYQSKGQYAQAIADFNKAIELNSKDDGAYTNRGVAYSKKGQDNQALADYNKAIELNPKNNTAYYNMACLYSVTKNTVAACKWLQKSIDLGYSHWGYIKKDSALDNIRNSFCFKKIMAGK
jgi:Flp pilus assembly protein TadD